MRDKSDGGSGRGSGCTLQWDGECAQVGGSRRTHLSPSPCTLSAISASPTSVILSFCGRDSKHLFLLFLFLPTLLSLPRFSSSVCPFHFRQCLDCIIWVSIVVVVEAIIASVYLLSIVIKAGCETDSDFIKRAGWVCRDTAAGPELGLRKVPVAPSEPLILLCPFLWKWGFNTQIMWVFWSAVPQKLFVRTSFWLKNHSV